MIKLWYCAETLFASDAVARGLDFGGKVELVINYDAPIRATTYVHRLGRTGRAGRKGTAVTLLTPKQVR